MTNTHTAQSHIQKIFQQAGADGIKRLLPNIARHVRSGTLSPQQLFEAALCLVENGSDRQALVGLHGVALAHEVAMRHGVVTEAATIQSSIRSLHQQLGNSGHVVMRSGNAMTLKHLGTVAAERLCYLLPADSDDYPVAALRPLANRCRTEARAVLGRSMVSGGALTACIQ